MPELYSYPNTFLSNNWTQKLCACSTRKILSLFLLSFFFCNPFFFLVSTVPPQALCVELAFRAQSLTCYCLLLTSHITIISCIGRIQSNLFGSSSWQKGALCWSFIGLQSIMQLSKILFAVVYMCGKEYHTTGHFEVLPFFAANEFFL